MNFQRVKSSNLHSIAHDGSHMGARFNCAVCKGTGESDRKTVAAITRGTDEKEPCFKCEGTGHTGTYHAKDVPAEVFEKVRTSPSPGKAFNSLVKGQYEVVKQ